MFTKITATQTSMTVKLFAVLKKIKKLKVIKKQRGKENI